jgi:hypothetical protein
MFFLTPTDSFCYVWFIFLSCVGSGDRRQGLALLVGPNWVGFLPEHAAVSETFLNKNRMMDNVQNINNCINIPSSQTFASYSVTTGTCNFQILTPLDTVGAVCVDAYGNLAAACSSGGVALKHPGRVGQVCLFCSCDHLFTL